MKHVFAHALTDQPETLLSRAGYVMHCVEAGRACYHRPLNDARFPRFHLYVRIVNSKMEIDLHFDALDSIRHKGNHDQSWAYEGGRVSTEMHKIVETISGNVRPNTISHPSEPSTTPL
ncbi:MAG: hypothetical protein UY76_C0010G0012 [Candidatus Uhrbacteria bacterium GW2011_GWA2_52_8d]|uniref:Uncharacterized protein n=1 Tax=Candidatus Uhrbacteria bacterium GW2011_GWA2_52_8d TaxID=1618979 RepID=A0A0G1XQA0_9BACT|nr:MAG: hypothetical protein UY76_C0010G0012 [Candidatus Uhrbacteria bacterium GW2011_GWA2_52_8d]